MTRRAPQPFRATGVVERLTLDDPRVQAAQALALRIAEIVEEAACSTPDEGDLPGWQVAMNGALAGVLAPSLQRLPPDMHATLIAYAQNAIPSAANNAIGALIPHGTRRI